MVAKGSLNLKKKIQFVLQAPKKCAKSLSTIFLKIRKIQEQTKPQKFLL